MLPAPLARRSGTRPRRARATLLACLAPAITLPALLHARTLELSLSPGAPTWQDPLIVTVSGLVETSCGPDIVELGNPRLAFAPGGIALDLDLTERPCSVLAPPSTHPFAVTAVVDPLLIPGIHRIRVHDRPQGTVVDFPAFVVFEVGGLQLLLPSVARSDQPVTIGVRGWASCPWLDGPEVDAAAKVIKLEVGAECHILPPGPSLFELEATVGPLAPGNYEVRLTDRIYERPFLESLVKRSFRVWDAAGCVPSDTSLCLRGGRFRVSATWRDFADRTGVGHGLPFPGNDGSGLIWFFKADNAELTVKVLDGCTGNHKWWVFLSSGSTVEYEVRVEDTETHTVRTYSNQSGQIPQLIADTSAFDCP